MRGFKIFIVIMSVLLAVWLTLAILYLVNQRTIEAEVINVTNDIITFKDSTGNLWDIENGTYQVGDKVILRFNDKGTDFITDDEIIKVKENEQ